MQGARQVEMRTQRETDPPDAASTSIQAGRNELLNRDAAAHGETCVNKVGVEITAEAHGVGAK